MVWGTIEWPINCGLMTRRNSAAPLRLATQPRHEAPGAGELSPTGTGSIRRAGRLRHYKSAHFFTHETEP